MADFARGAVEILVHITAPSGGKDDARYRALAQTYLDFKPERRLELNDHQLDEHMEADSQLQEELLQSTQDRPSQASYQPQEDEPESIPISILSTQQHDLNRIEELELRSPELSFNDVLDNADSPVFRNFITCKSTARDAEVGSSQGSWKPPPSTVEDSQPEMRRHDPTLSSPSRALEAFVRQIRSSDNSSVGDRNRAAEDPSPELTYNLTVSSTSETTIPDKYPTTRENESSSPMPSSDAIPAKNGTQLPLNISPQKTGTILKRKHIEISQSRPCSGISQVSTEGSVTTSTMEKLSKKQRISVDKVQVIQSDHTTSSKITQVITPVSSHVAISKAVSSNEATTLTSSDAITSSEATEVATPIPSNAPTRWLDKLEIRPPPPKASTRELTPESLITYSLRETANQVPFSTVYRPAEQMRELRPMERGYWLIDCENWDIQLRKKCWERLGEYIGNGNTGWGVSCVREEGFEKIRIYCWGIVVRHIYLCMYLASTNKIKKARACWIDGEGKIIIRMQA